MNLARAVRISGDGGQEGMHLAPIKSKKKKKNFPLAHPRHPVRAPSGSITTFLERSPTSRDSTCLAKLSSKMRSRKCIVDDLIHA